MDGRCRQNQACRGRSRGLQKRPAEQDPGLTASPAALWRLLHFSLAPSSGPASSDDSLLLSCPQVHLGVLSSLSLTPLHSSRDPDN